MIAACLLYLGLCALAVSMKRHAPALLGPWDRPGLATRAKPLGWLLVGLSLLAALVSADWPRALVTWFGLWPLAGGVVLLALTYDARAARAAGLLAVALIVLAPFF